MFMGWEIPATWFQSLNAFFIVILGTTVAGYWAKRKLNNKLSSSLFKMILGLIIMGTGFFFMTGATAQFEATGSSAMYWLVLAYLFHTVYPPARLLIASKQYLIPENYQQECLNLEFSY